mgnify:CR=1 FL=1
MALFFTVHSQNETVINGKDKVDMTDRLYVKDTNLLFFPTRILIDTVNAYRQEKDSSFYQKREKFALFINTWFSKQLTALDEPKLYKNYDFEAYRFTWLRTFHNPIAIRLEKKNNEYFLIVKKANGLGGYDPGQLVQNDTIRITERQWKGVIRKVNNIYFWGIPTIKKSNKVVKDGAMWILEAKKDAKYKMVYRHSPKATVIRKLCVMLLKMSELKICKNELY